MAKGNPRDERKEGQWRRRVREWRASGLSVRAYCDLHDLSEPSFYAWRRELARRQAQQTLFLPVQVEAGTLPGTHAGLELALAQGRTLRVAVGFDAKTLRQLLAVLEEQQPC